jgi:hypothetical protein
MSEQVQAQTASNALALNELRVLDKLIVAQCTHQGSIVLLVVCDDDLTVVLVNGMQNYAVVLLGILEPPGKQLLHTE